MIWCYCHVNGINYFRSCHTINYANWDREVRKRGREKKGMRWGGGKRERGGREWEGEGETRGERKGMRGGGGNGRGEEGNEKGRGKWQGKFWRSENCSTTKLKLIINENYYLRTWNLLKLTTIWVDEANPSPSQSLWEQNKMAVHLISRTQ